MTDKKPLLLTALLLLFLLVSGCDKNKTVENTIAITDEKNTSPQQEAEAANEQEAEAANEQEPAASNSSMDEGITVTDTSELLLNKETDHFLIYCEDSEAKDIDTLALILEDNYPKITSALEVTPTEKISLWIYSSMKSFHTAIGIPDAPDNIIAVGIQDGIYMVSPELMDGAYITSPEQVIVHEFTHVLQGSINVPRPVWLNEGVASYFGKEIPNIEKDMTSLATSQRIPSLEDMSASYEKLISCAAYSVVEYIVDTYGYEGLNKLLRKPEDYMYSFGISEEQFISDWHAYIAIKYGDTEKIP